jgi:hypothetical protein
MSMVRMSDIKKRVTMNGIVFTAIMMINTRAMRKRPGPQLEIPLNCSLLSGIVI